MQISQQNALYALLGTSFGGDGQQTFCLPELRGRQIIGYGQAPGHSNFPFAAVGGAESVTLTPAQGPLAAHTHTASASLSISTAAATAATPTLANGNTAYLANAAAGSAGNALKGLYATSAPAAGATASIPLSGAGSGGTVTVNTNSGTSASNPVPLMNPYLALNFCIALNGIFPSRN